MKDEGGRRVLAVRRRNGIAQAKPWEREGILSLSLGVAWAGDFFWGASEGGISFEAPEGELGSGGGPGSVSPATTDGGVGGWTAGGRFGGD